MKKYCVLVIFIIITLMSSVVFASDSAIFEVVEDNVCTIEINDYSSFEKRMISSDISKRQVTLQMQITNGATLLEQEGEVMIVLDNSDSMNDLVDDTSTRKTLIFESAKSLINSLLEANDNLQIGVVSFSSTKSTDSDGTLLEGTLADATLISELTSDADALSEAIDSIIADGTRTDLDAGITLASQYFSAEENNKYMIVLTDGLPNIALDYDNYYFSDDVIEKTIAKLKTMAESYELITMLTGISNPDNTVTGTEYTYSELIEMIFGTEENPTAGTFYYVQDSEVEETITQDIYNQLLPVAQTITDLVIVDYFPQEIVDNFDFAYVASPNIGEISATIDTTNNCIVWTISELASGETAYVQYTLTLKDDYSSDIVGVILDTNEKVDITYTDFDGTTNTVTSDETPKVRVTELTATELPDAGTPMLIVISVLATGICLFSTIRLYNFIKKTR